MEWLGWIAALIAAFMTMMYFRSVGELARANTAIGAAQKEIAKLAYLWAYEVKERRSVENEYDRPSCTIESECKTKYAAQDDLYWLSEHFLFQTSDGGPIDRHGLEDNPKQWGERLVPILVEIAARHMDLQRR